MCYFLHFLTKRGFSIVFTFFVLNSYAQDTLLKVPVIFHVVYGNGSQNVSNRNIHTLLEKTNLDLSHQHMDTHLVVSSFKDVVGNASIQLQLAKRDVDGSPISAIRRVATSHGVFGNNDIHFSSLGGDDVVSPDVFLNVWICDLAPGIDGYGTPPGTMADVDGIVIDYTKLVGIDGRNERALSHELGHWLALEHLWGAGGCSDDDGVTDTPPQEASSMGCDLSKSSCGTLDMVQNFMDYSDEDCRLLFTKGQVDVMRSALLNDRASIVNNSPITLSIASDRYTVFNVFPNPFYSRFSIETSTDDVHSVRIFDFKFDMIDTVLFEVSGMTLHLENKGVFFLLFLDEDGNSLGIEKVVGL